MEEERVKLGLALKKDVSVRRTSIQEKDEEPRYEISKIQALAETDLLMTQYEN